MTTKKASAKKDEPKATKAKGKEADVETDEVEVGDDDESEAVEATSKKVAKASVEEKKSSKKAEEAPKAEKAEAKPAKQAKASTSAKVYQPASSYAVGETIFHPVWKVEGTVMEVGKTSDGSTKIVVDFPDFGVKRLIAEHQATKA